MSVWKAKTHDSTAGCDLCGGTEEVIRWVHEETGEERCTCVNCEDAAGSVR